VISNKNNFKNIVKPHAQTGAYVNRWKFTGHELDRETGLYYAGARYYDPKLSVFLSVDALFEYAPGWTPYRYGFNNPIRYTDPTGMWEWNKSGNLVAQKGDNVNTLAKFLGTNTKNSQTILERGGYLSKGNLNLKMGNQISKTDLWLESKSKSKVIVNNTKEATIHYFKGKGVSADVGDKSTEQLLSSKKFKEKHNKITSQSVASEGHFSLDLTNETFHIGRTNVDYKVSSNGKSSSVTYTLFARDGFWDPDFVDEKVLGGWLDIDKFKPD